MFSTDDNTVWTEFVTIPVPLWRPALLGRSPQGSARGFRRCGLAFELVAVTRAKPEARQARTLPKKHWALLIGTVLFALAVVLPLLRQRGTRSWNTIWAEDGFEYFEQARREGGLEVMFRGYQGYLQLPPRIFGAVSAGVPIRDLALFMALSSAVLGAAIALFVYYAATPWIGSRVVCIALASLIVLMPVLATENTANVTNSIWIFAAALPWALTSRRERPLDTVLYSVMAFLGATSTSLCFAFLPLAIGYALWRRTRARIVVAGAFVAGLVVQGLVDLHSWGAPLRYLPGASVDVPRSISSVADVFGYQVVGTYLFGNRGTQSRWLVDHGLLAIVATIIFVAILAVLLAGVDRQRQALSLVFVGYSAVFLVMPVWVRQAVQPRYTVVPIFLLASSLAVLVAARNKSRTELARRVWSTVFVAQILLVTCIGFSVTNYRSLSPSWSTSVAEAQATCASVRASTIVTLRADAFNVYPVKLPCRDLQ